MKFLPSFLQLRGMCASKRKILTTSVTALLTVASVHAATQTWNGGSTANGLWSTTLNWLGGTPPGSTSSTTNTDIALFNTAIANTWGNAVGNPIVIFISMV